MKKSQQKEFDLWQALETASKFPEMADLSALLLSLEQAILNQPWIKQLHIAGDVLVKLSLLCAARAELMIGEWEYQHNPTEPVVNLENCVDLFVQSLSLELAEFFEEADSVQYPENRQKKSSQAIDISTIDEVDKAERFNEDKLYLEEIRSESELADEIINLAHEENVEEWTKAIALYLKKLQEGSIRLLDLQKALDMPLIEVWLGLLLGGYSLEQRGEFYKTQDVWIRF